MSYYNKGLGEGFFVVHHGQDHIHIKRGASFIGRNTLQVERTASEAGVIQNQTSAVSASIALPAAQLSHYQFYQNCLPQKTKQNKTGVPPNNTCNVVAKVTLSCASGCNLCLH